MFPKVLRILQASSQYALHAYNLRNVLNTQNTSQKKIINSYFKERQCENEQASQGEL